MSVSVMPCHLSPKPRRASASTCHVSTRTDSSPFFERMTSPVAAIQAPSVRLVKPLKSSVPLAVAISWMAPLESRRVAKARRPMSRSNMMRPATVTVVPVLPPSSSSAWVACRSAARSVTSTR
jgi:hypothetical protein